MLEKILAMNPLRVTPELAALRDSLITERLDDSCVALERLLEE